MKSNAASADVNNTSTNLTSRAKRLVQKMHWLSPANALSSAKSRDFGRSIERSLTEIAAGSGVKLLKLRQRDAAVVISIDHYEEIVRMKELCAELIERTKSQELAEAGDQFDALYQRITASRQWADSLFTASPDELAASYQPGRTEDH